VDFGLSPPIGSVKVQHEEGVRSMGDEVRLVDLEVIKRYSLAVRQESAPAEDLLAALDASREAVLATMAPAPAPAKPARRPRKKATT
jgi:hypothetical protein